MTWRLPQPEENWDPDAEVQLRREPCEACDDGWCEGRPTPTPNGPHYPHFRCERCDGTGFVLTEFRTVDEDDLEEIAP